MRLVRYTYPSFRPANTTFARFQRSPWLGLETEIDRLFETALTEFGAASGTRFPVDLYEDQNNTYVRAELPGVNRDDVNVELADGYLTITGTRKAVTADGKADDSASTSFNRAVSIADDVATDNVTAAFENGVLTVTLPKREEAKPKKISVAVK
jgi:HSP20 family protein